MNERYLYTATLFFFPVALGHFFGIAFHHSFLANITMRQCRMMHSFIIIIMSYSYIQTAYYSLLIHGVMT